MATNLLTTNFSGGVFESGTALTTGSYSDFADSPFSGRTERQYSTVYAYGDQRPNNINDCFTGQNAQCQFDPHNARRFIVVYEDTSTRNGVARIGVISADGTNITYSNAYTFAAAACREPIFAFDPSVPNKFVVTQRWQSSNTRWNTAKVGTISDLGGDPTGYQITYGGDVSVSPGYGAADHRFAMDIAFDPSTPGRFAIVSYYLRISIFDTGVVRVCDVANAGQSASTISVGSEFNFAAAGYSAHYARIAWNPHVANQFLIAWAYAASAYFSTSTYGLVSAMNVNSSRTVTHFASDTAFYTGNISYVSIAFDPNAATRFAVTFRKDDDSGHGGVAIGVLNGANSIGFAVGEFKDASVKFTDISYDTHNAGRGVIAYQDDADSDKGKAKCFLFGYPSSLGLSAESTFNESATFNPVVSQDSQLASDRFLIGFKDGSTGTLGQVIAARRRESSLALNLIPTDTTGGNHFSYDLQVLIGLVGNFTVTGTTAAPETTTFILKIIQGSPAKQIAWADFTNIKWPRYWDPSVGWVHRPTLSTTNDAVDVYSFTTYDNGTTWYATIVGQDIK